MQNILYFKMEEVLRLAYLVLNENAEEDRANM
jgi:hypothetical protein